MGGGVNRFTIDHSCRIEQIGELAQSAWRRELQLLVEITVEETSPPINTDQLAAHHRREIGRVMSLLQEDLIRSQVTQELQLPGEALNRHVGQGEQTIKANTDLAELLFVGRLQISLGSEGP